MVPSTPAPGYRSTTSTVVSSSTAWCRGSRARSALAQTLIFLNETTWASFPGLINNPILQQTAALTGRSVDQRDN
jgi:hypothetical protein